MSILANIVQKYGLPDPDCSGFGERYVALAAEAGLNLSVAITLAEREPLTPYLRQRKAQLKGDPNA